MPVDLCALPLFRHDLSGPLTEAGDVLTHIDQENVAESMLAGNRRVI